jgi:transcriptional antiterminator NusG
MIEKRDTMPSAEVFDEAVEASAENLSTPPEETGVSPASQAPAADSARPAKWCVLRVASNKEETVREALERKVKIEGIEEKIRRILVPMEKRPAPRGRGAKKIVDRKMYPGYIFLEMVLEEDGSIDEDAWFAIKETTGVGDFIGSAGKPSPMSQGDVDKMLMQIEKAQDGGAVTVEFAKGDMVKIKEGAFENFEGAVDEVLPDKGLVRVVEYWLVEKT